MVSESDFIDMLAKAEVAGDVRLAGELKRILGEFRAASREAAAISLDSEVEVILQEVCAASGLSRSEALNLAVKAAFNIPAMVAAAPGLSRQLAIIQGIKKDIKRPAKCLRPEIEAEREMSESEPSELIPYKPFKPFLEDELRPTAREAA